MHALLRLSVWFVLLGGLWLTGASVRAATPEQIDRWVADLNSDLYVVRERAMSNLAGAGRAALDPLIVAADGNNLETATRAIRLLMEMSKTEDFDQSLAVLERVAKLKNRPVERIAAKAILQGVREKKAVAAIKRLGGVERSPYLVDGQQYVGHLYLGAQWTGGDDGLRYVKELSQLQILEIHGADISDEGIRHLRGMTTLIELQLYGAKVTPAGVDALRKTLPNTNVQHRLGALLGVRGSPDQVLGGARILDVQPGTAAADAGLRPNDVVTSFDGKVVQNFDDLTAEIAKFRPGEKATLEIVRDTEKMTKEVTFGKWGAVQ